MVLSKWETEKYHLTFANMTSIADRIFCGALFNQNLVRVKQKGPLEDESTVSSLFASEIYTSQNLLYASKSRNHCS